MFELKDFSVGVTVTAFAAGAGKRRAVNSAPTAAASAARAGRGRDIL
jgi:hypothetical protein